MIKNKVYSFIIGCFLCLLLGCVESGNTLHTSEIEEDCYQRGQQFIREGAYLKALQSFTKVTQNRGEAPESHLELGRLYLDWFHDPISAIYHFKCCLEYQPNSEKAEMVKQLINTAEKAFAKQLPGAPYENELDRINLMDALQQVRTENITLKTEIDRLQKQLAYFKKDSYPQDISSTALPMRLASLDDSQVTVPNPVIATRLPINTREKTYTVNTGDTLSSISGQVYGTTARWNEIYEANRHLLKTPHSLKVGQELKIP
jgi:LysM repeat protein